MKKLLVTLFGFLFIVSCHDNDFYRADPIATSNAQWKVGEKTAEESCPDKSEGCYTLFLGITKTGYALIQDYYPSGQKLSDPYLVMPVNLVTSSWWNREKGINGLYTGWYESGQKLEEITFKEGQWHGAMIFWDEDGKKREESYFKYGLRDGVWTEWYKNGQKHAEMHYRNNAQVGVWKEWDMQGNLIEETDYGGY